ncbi:hypothetical protein BD311DRAFT_767618 [Dichomitus squalens]|uniref:Uncharacterized protein n=1 Tax=Dichomitus squalens TaxID=114155 RepID=A0A4Q9MA37_9APHY|nr:hypothetical protein BD311DRAFT_767618 [Dichomitus squalens]
MNNLPRAGARKEVRWADLVGSVANSPTEVGAATSIEEAPTDHTAATTTDIARYVHTRVVYEEIEVNSSESTPTSEPVPSAPLMRTVELPPLLAPQTSSVHALHQVLTSAQYAWDVRTLRMPNINDTVLEEPAFLFTQEVKSFAISLHPQPFTTAYDDTVVVIAEYEGEPISVRQVFAQMLAALYKPLEEHDLPSVDALRPHAEWAATVRAKHTSRRDVLRNVDLYPAERHRPGLWFHGINVEEDTHGHPRYEAVFCPYPPITERQA